MGTREISPPPALTPRPVGAVVGLDARRESSALTWLALAAVVAATAAFVQIGADVRWLAALGRSIAEGWSIRDGLPYAAAPSAGWENVPVLGELVLHALQAAFADRGLVFAQIVAVCFAFAVLARDMRAAGAADAARAFALLAVVLAAAPALLVVRAQLFSVALFPLLVLLLRSEARDPSRRIWLLVPLLALWANLHGGVLVGVAVAAAYLLIQRLRPEPAVAVGVLAAMSAALLATPSLLRTAAYYHGVLTGEVAERGAGLWAPLSLRAPFDVVFIVVALGLCAAILIARPPAWELAVLAGLAGMAIQANRNTVWFALFAAVPAARALRLRSRHSHGFERLVLLCAALLAFAAFAAAVREPVPTAAGSRLLARTADAAARMPVLADPINAEQLALAGQRIWIGNPLDAFSPSDQRAYLDWLEGLPQGDRLLTGPVCAVLVTIDGEQQLRLAQSTAFHEVARDSQAVLYRRTDCSTAA